MKPDASKNGFLESFRHALEGIGATAKGRNFRVQIAAGAAAVAAGLLLRISPGEWIAVALCIGLVLGGECANTALEAAVDLSSPGLHPLAKRAKDAAAGAVLILSIASATIGAIIFLPRLTLAQTYGREDRSLSPVPTQASYDWASGNTAINFVDPVSGKPAKLHGDWDLRGFQVSVDGGDWKWAEKSFVNEKMFPDTVFVEGQDGVHTNVCVRYAWDDYPDGSLVSADGLPVGPFELKATILDFEERAEEVHAETAEPNPHADSAEN